MYARRFAAGQVATSSTRARDVLPLPCFAAADVRWPSNLASSSTAVRFINLVAAALNFMFAGNKEIAVPARAGPLHHAVLARLMDKVVFLLTEIAQVGAARGVSGAFLRLAKCGVAGRGPLLRKDDVDVFSPAARVDPLQFMPMDAQQLLTNPRRLFPAGVGHISGRLRQHDPHAGDSASLTLKMLRAGRIVLARHADCAAATFVIDKRDTGKLREIWNGSRITEAALKSWMPPCLATPASLTTLEGSLDRPIFVSTRDGKVFFDQLAVPLDLRRFLGRPLVRLADLRSSQSSCL